MSRAITGNLASSLVASTRPPRSKPKSAALPAIASANGAHAANRERFLSPAIMGQVVIAPCVEHHQGPQDLAVVSPTVDVLCGESCHHAWVDQAAAAHGRESRGHDVS